MFVNDKTHTLAANMMLLSAIGKLWWGFSGMGCQVVTYNPTGQVFFTNFHYI